MYIAIQIVGTPHTTYASPSILRRFFARSRSRSRSRFVSSSCHSPFSSDSLSRTVALARRELLL